MSESGTPEFASQQDRWNHRYSAAAHLFGTEPNAWLRMHAGLWRKGSRVLSVADGDGRNSVWLASQGLQVDAFDFSEIGVANARKLAEARGVSVNFSVSDCDSYHWPHGTLDGVAAIFIQFADPDMRGRLFANMVESLKPGGLLVLQGYGLDQLKYKTGGPSEPSHLYTEPMLREAFASLDILRLESHEAELTEGQAHSGRSALVSLVARRP